MPLRFLLAVLANAFHILLLCECCFYISEFDTSIETHDILDLEGSSMLIYFISIQSVLRNQLLPKCHQLSHRQSARGPPRSYKSTSLGCPI